MVKRTERFEQADIEASLANEAEGSGNFYRLPDAEGEALEPGYLESVPTYREIARQATEDMVESGYISPEQGEAWMMYYEQEIVRYFE